MSKTWSALAFCLVFGTSSYALAQSATSSSQQTSTPSVTKYQARYDAGVAGYTMISHLTKDKSGDWIGAGSKGPFLVTPSGKVLPR